MKFVMLTVLVLICSVFAAPEIGDCTRDNGTVVMRVPGEFANPITCFLPGQVFLAETSIAQDLGHAEKVKIVCARGDFVDTAIQERQPVSDTR